MKTPLSPYTLAIASFRSEIAPCFDAASRFQLWNISEGNATALHDLEFGKSGGIERVKVLVNTQARVLICNGIQTNFIRMLQADGCEVLWGIGGAVEKILSEYLAGRIEPVDPDNIHESDASFDPDEDKIAIAINLFRTLGWQVKQIDRQQSFPIDLVAERSCPLCGRPVRVAICCGGHIYRIDEEIREFKRVSSGGYNARVYMNEARKSLAARCNEFNIELLEPSTVEAWCAANSTSCKFPPLKGRIDGHEKLGTVQADSEVK